MYIDKNKILENLTKENVIKVLESLGSDYIEDKKGNLIFRTVCHHEHAGNGKHHLYYYEKSKSEQNSKLFYCVTDCQDERGFDIFKLVEKAFANHGEKISFYDSMKYVLNIIGTEERNYCLTHKEAEKLQVKEINKKIEKEECVDFRKEVKQSTEFKKIDPGILDVFPKLHYKGWLDENISHQSMDKYNIRFDVYSNKIIIPHYDIGGQLVGIKGRSLNREDEINNNKYVYMKIEGKEYSYPQSSNLYGLNFNKDQITFFKQVVLFESEKSVLQADGYNGVSVAASVSGSMVSHEQLRLLYNLGAKDITLAFDKEYKNEKEMQEYIDKYKMAIEKYKKMFQFYIIVDTKGLLEYKDSPSDKGKEIYKELFLGRIKL